jgi:hypothetical protein
MKVLLLLSLLAGVAGAADAQAPPPSTAKPAPPPSTARPAPPPSTAKPAPSTAKPRTTAKPATARSGMAITVTDQRGGTIPGVTVDVTGPTPRNGVTDAGGQVNFPGLQAGTYLLRFSGDEVTAFEREVIVRAGQIADLDIRLNAAPPAKEAPVAAAAAPPPPAPPVSAGPAGQPQVVSIVNLVERELISGNAPRKDTLVSCSGSTRTMLVQLNQPQARRVYEGAELLYYVVAGEGTVTLGGKDVPVEAGGYASVPRGTEHSITRRGRRPLILLAVLSGEACEEAR